MEASQKRAKKDFVHKTVNQSCLTQPVSRASSSLDRTNTKSLEQLKYSKLHNVSIDRSIDESQLRDHQQSNEMLREGLGKIKPSYGLVSGEMLVDPYCYSDLRVNKADP